MPFPEDFFISVDQPDQAKRDGFNQPGFLFHPYSFAKWREMVIPQLAKIASTKSGMVLLNAFQASQKWTRISPMFANTCNAGTSGLRSKDDTTARYFLAEVTFEPYMYMSGSACYKHKHLTQRSPGAKPDEVLFHELVHAYRQLSLLNNEKPLGGGLTLYENDEDFFAVMVTNIYITDFTNKSGTAPRADHHHYRPLAKGLSHSFTFYQSSEQVLPLMDRFVKECGVLAAGLSKVPAHLNPLTAYFQNYHEVKALSKSALAKQRDFVIPKLPKDKPDALALPEVPDDFQVLIDAVLALAGHPRKANLAW